MPITGKLSAIEVSKAKGPAVLHDGGGLYLRVSKPGEEAGAVGAKSWVFRFQVDGKRRDMGLGSFPDLPLVEARDKATELRRLVRDGVDPLTEREAKRQAAALAAAKQRTFREAAEEHIARRQSGWTNSRNADQWRHSLETYAYPTIGNLSVSKIDTGLVIKVLDPIWATIPETAGRVRGRIEAILDAEKVRGHRTGENPARWRGNLDQIFSRHIDAKQAAREKANKEDHHRALPIDQTPAFMAELRAREGTSPLALEFVILTTTRTSETLLATWGEFDIAGTCWNIPGQRMKSGKPHRVPLSSAAMLILEKLMPVAMRSDGTLDPEAPVFPGMRPALPLSESALRAMLLSMGWNDRATVHGFRSTFSDWASECTAFPNMVVEMALAHVIENKTAAAYRRGDLFNRRAKLMQAWADYCSAPVAAAGDNVTAIRASIAG